MCTQEYRVPSPLALNWSPMVSFQEGQDINISHPVPWLPIAEVKFWVSVGSQEARPTTSAQPPFIRQRVYLRCGALRIQRPWLPSPQLVCKVHDRRGKARRAEAAAFPPLLWSTQLLKHVFFPERSIPLSPLLALESGSEIFAQRER